MESIKWLLDSCRAKDKKEAEEKKRLEQQVKTDELLKALWAWGKTPKSNSWRRRNSRQNRKYP